MSNTTTGNGLRVYRGSGSWAAGAGIMEFPILDNYGTTLGQYEPVSVGVDLATAGAGTLIQYVAGGTVKAVGVLDGVTWFDTTGQRRFSDYWPAGTRTYNGQPAIATVYVDPSLLYIARTKFTAQPFGNASPSTLLYANQAFANANFTTGTIGVVDSLGHSTISIDMSTATFTSTLDVTVIGLAPGEVLNAAGNSVLVRLNQTFWAAPVTGRAIA